MAKRDSLISSHSSTLSSVNMRHSTLGFLLRRHGSAYKGLEAVNDKDIYSLAFGASTRGAA